ncbi:MAG: tetratricopeptide repeat protein [PVC group bacterium]
MAKTSAGQKIGLVIGSLVFTLLIIEIGLRLGGFIVLDRRDRANQARLAGKSEFRIMCVGESTTYCGNNYSSYPRQLEKILNEKEPFREFTVINQGKPGCSTAYILKMLECWLDQYEPDMVIAMMGINDGMGNKPGFYNDTDADAGELERFLGNLRIWKAARYIWDNGLITLRETGLLEPLSSEDVPETSKGDLITACEYDYTTEANLRAELRKYPEDSKPYIELGRLYLDRNQYEEALVMFNRALKRDPRSEKANIGAARYYLNQQSHSMTLDYCLKALAINPSSDEAWTVSGLSSLSKRSYGSAAKKLQKALELNPLNDEALTALAWCYWKFKNFPESQAAAEKAIEINPDNRWAYGILGLCHQKQGNDQAALEVYQKVIERFPFSYLACKEMGQLYQKLGEPEKAREYFQKARSLILSTYNRGTSRNYSRMKAILDQRGIQLVSVQYPVRSIGPLKKMLGSQDNIIFVDNEAVFREALNRTDYSSLFKDKFAIDFGHCTREGNRLLAENIVRVLFREYFSVSGLQ